MLFLTLFSALFIPIHSSAVGQSGQGQVTQAMDFKNCESQGYLQNPLYQLTESGNLQIDSKDPSIVSFKKSPEMEEVRLRNAWYGKKYIETVTLKRNGGKPESVTVLSDPKMASDYKDSMPEGISPMESILGTKTTFAYAGNKCFVKEVASVFEKKEVVNYDHHVCNEILELAKKATSKKLQECKMTFAKMNEVLKGYKDKYEEAGKELSIGFGFPQKNSNKPAFFDQDWNMLGTISYCNSTRAMYGMPVDPDTDAGYGYGGPFGGPFAGQSKDMPGTTDGSQAFGSMGTQAK